MLRPARRLRAGPPAREQGSALGLHGQGDHEAQEALLQRDLLRLPHLLPPAGGRAAPGHRDPAPRPEVGQLHRGGPGRGRECAAGRGPRCGHRSGRRAELRRRLRDDRVFPGGERGPRGLRLPGPRGRGHERSALEPAAPTRGPRAAAARWPAALSRRAPGSVRPRAIPDDAEGDDLHDGDDEGDDFAPDEHDGAEAHADPAARGRTRLRLRARPRRRARRFSLFGWMRRTPKGRSPSSDPRRKAPLRASELSAET